MSALAQITKGIRAAHGFVPDLIPRDVLAAISQDELYDRLVHAGSLVRKSQTASDPVLRKGYASIAQATLCARPRADVARESAALIVKAAGAPLSAQAAALRRQAQELLEQHPPAPRREDSAAVAVVKKGGGDSVTVVYDAAGNAVGVCDPGDIQPVGSLADITKARVGKARRPAQTPGRSPGRR